MVDSAARLVPFVLTVCGIGELDSHAARGVSHVLSILDPRIEEQPSFAAFGMHQRLELRFDDILEHLEGHVAPQRDHVDEILRFTNDLMTDLSSATHLLVHCHMGISRSSAALTLILARLRPDLPAPQILDEILRIRPHAWPNLRLIELGDAALERNGELIEALSTVYRLQLQRHPELQRYFIECGRQREVDHALRDF
jgi:predicted protein tyrosine phosphatase